MVYRVRDTAGDGVQGCFQAQAGRKPSCDVKTLVIKLREGAEFVRMSARKHASPS
jgi:hypothetical protein